MQKIKNLLKELGASNELQDKFMEELQNYKTSVVSEANDTLKARLNKAKEICLEEFENEKKKLARKVEVFLEAKTQTIDREAKKQAMIGESKAASTLRDVKCLLEGVTIGESNADVQAAQETIEKLRDRLNKLADVKTTLEEQVKRSNTIAMKALERNKLLEQKRATQPVVTESKKTATKTLREEAAKPKTHREAKPVISEQKVQSRGDSDVESIAATLDGSPAYIG